ncbi:hypothetical protein [Microscilla marina]|nr:hypothetical protein [Microscilla marina]
MKNIEQTQDQQMTKEFHRLAQQLSPETYPQVFDERFQQYRAAMIQQNPSIESKLTTQGMSVEAYAKLSFVISLQESNQVDVLTGLPVQLQNDLLRVTE